ncbi:MAG: hypothetical protein K0S53_814 [Bacteroidetes bacterium]|jgi:hypothetical protein|nr:hypothetical protein [Bacteroidota bacterium]
MAVFRKEMKEFRDFLEVFVGIVMYRSITNAAERERTLRTM